MHQWFLSLPEFIEFLFHLGKAQLSMRLSLTVPCKQIYHLISITFLISFKEEHKSKGDLCHMNQFENYEGTSIGEKGRFRTRRYRQNHRMEARKSAGKGSTLDLKPTKKDTRSPKQEQLVAPQNGPWSNKKC